MTLLNASILWTWERGGGGAGEKLRIAQKRYRAKRFFILPLREIRSPRRRSRESMSETLPGSAFLAHALSAKVGDITNISIFEPTDENMLCFVTFWCGGKEAKLRGRSETLQI